MMLTTVILSDISCGIGIIGVNDLHDTDTKHENQIDLLFPSQLQLQKLWNGQCNDPQVCDDVDGLLESIPIAQ